MTSRRIAALIKKLQNRYFDFINITLTGYHGTSKEAAKAIIAGTFFISNATNWLGEGVYFFQDDIDSAFRWSKKKENQRGARNDLQCAIVKCTIKARREQIFDLNHPDRAEQYRKYKRSVINRVLKVKGLLYNADEEDPQDSMWLDAICEDRDIHVVIAETNNSFMPYDLQKYDWTRFPTATEICIKPCGMKHIKKKEILDDDLIQKTKQRINEP